MLAGEHRKAVALGAGDDHQRAIEIGLLQAHTALRRKAHHPIALLLEAVEGAVEIHHPGHGQMLQGSGGHLGHRAGEPGAAALGQHQTVGAEGLGTAGDRPQVVGIGDAVEGHQQGRLPQIAAALDQAGEVEGVSGGGLEHDALVHGAAGDLAEAGPGDFLHQHPGGLGLPQRLQEGGAEAHLGSAPDAMHGPAALQRRLGGMATPDQVAGDVFIGMQPLGGLLRRAGLHHHRRAAEARRQQTARPAVLPAGCRSPIAAALAHPAHRLAAAVPAAPRLAVPAAVPLPAGGPLALAAPVTAGGTEPIAALRGSAPVGGALTAGLPAPGLVAIGGFVPVTKRTTGGTRAGWFAAPGSSPLVGAAFKSRAHGKGRLWIDLLQVI